MFSTHLDKLALYSCLSNLPSPQLHELRTTCKQFDYVSKQIFKNREYECQTSETHGLLYQPCCKYFGKLTSGDRTKFIRLEMTTNFTSHLGFLEVIQLWNVVSTSELFTRLADVLTKNHSLKELYLTSFPYKMGCNDSDKLYSALRGHSDLRRIMVRPHHTTPEFVDACTKWKSLDFIFIEIASDEDVPQFVRFASQVSINLVLLTRYCLTQKIPSSLLSLAVHMNSTSISQLSSALAQFSRLRKLSVGRLFYPIASDRASFFQALTYMKDLEHLNINWNLGLHLTELIGVLVQLPKFKSLQIANDIALAPIPPNLSFEVSSLSSWNLANTEQWVYLSSICYVLMHLLTC